MKLKYYLRGLGIGIIVTALLLGTFTASEKKAKGENADQESEKPTILAELEKGNKEDAKEESVEESVAQDLQEALANVTGADGETTSETEISAQDNAAKQEAEKTDKTEADKKEEQSKEKSENKAKSEDRQTEETNKEDSKTDSENNAKTDQAVKTTKTIIVAVYPGEGSYTISRKLASLGLVESADVYDKFLCQNGYDKRLASGNYEIEDGATPETIAKILTGAN